MRCSKVRLAIGTVRLAIGTDANEVEGEAMKFSVTSGE